MSDQIDTPIAVLAGKCDVWLHLLGENALRDPVRSGELDTDIVRHNSIQVRQLLKRICPAVVANVESISRNVVFFPVSSFGHSPVKIGPGDYAPDPRQLKPFMVEIPALWLCRSSHRNWCPAARTRWRTLRPQISPCARPQPKTQE